MEIHPDFSLAFVEFDDQGMLWSLDEIDLLDRTLAAEARRAAGGGVGIIAFAHGWKHDARVCDESVACFRTVLAQAAAETAEVARFAGSPPLRIVGVYLGWRGRSVTAPLVSPLSFWARKRAAERIGAGELVGVLSHLDRFVRRESEEGRFAGLIVIGHSFGGTMVYTALSNVLKARMVDAYEQRGRVPVAENVVRGFGNLVVLVNPAVEASAFATLHELVNAIGSFSPRQTPILVVVGSESDFPNRVWFPLGRKLDMLTQHAGPRSARALLTTAIGSYDPFMTHRLEAIAAPGAEAPERHVDDCICRLPIGALPAEETRRLAECLPSRRLDETRACGEGAAPCAAGLALGGARLTCLPGTAPTTPIWSVRATDEVVHGHSVFFTRPFGYFLRWVILDGFSRAAKPAG
ncbi:MAG TPA: hypothetical protein VFZ57_07710 [Thermoanaerobaculia bacterium]|nr:hypothetical protein [Thermoanaerobaculia bacterium]